MGVIYLDFKGDSLLCAMVGVASSDVPEVGNHYDFIDRLWLENPEVSKTHRDSLHRFLPSFVRSLAGTRNNLLVIPVLFKNSLIWP
jgi:hypothetical protein